jgi:hypothetical protein
MEEMSALLNERPFTGIYPSVPDGVCIKLFEGLEEVKSTGERPVRLI